MSSEAKIKILQMTTKGELQNAYSPLLNLVSKNNQLGDFTTKNLQFDKYDPVDIQITDEYDGSVNLIINDDKNYPKLINSRFSVLENNTFNIPVRSGNKVLNIYDDNTFNIDTLLFKLYNKIPKLKFKGIKSGGSFKCGSYIFYFKLSDADGNLTNIILESGIVQIHMGVPNSKKIRMGMQDENAEKTIEFELSGFDEGFDYVKVFYERCSTDDSQATVHSYFMITQQFPIQNNLCKILLTGNEEVLQIDKTDILNEFADIQTAKTQAVVDNVLFLGNTSAYELDYTTLQLIAWRIYPEIIDDADVGQIGANLYSLGGSSVYYNMENVYKYTGYWADELYRFGIVFIYDNNILSPVFNILGGNLNEIKGIEDFFEKVGDTYLKRVSEPEDFFFDKSNKLMNSKGVFLLPSKKLFDKKYANSLSPRPIGIKFNLQYLNTDSFTINDGNITEDSKSESIKSFLAKLHIKGFFFVRQKRIPSIIAQGMVVGLTGRYNGCIPVIKNQNGDYTTKSFLSKDRLLLNEGTDVRLTTEVTEKALFVPDYEINPATLNLIFTGQEFLLTKVGHVSFAKDLLNDHYYVNNFNSDLGQPKGDIKLTAVPKESKILTDGETYFSTRAGNPDEPYKTEDVNNVWNKTAPQNLTTSTSLIRGNWGSFVGMNRSEFQYGDIVNIKLNDWESEDTLKLEFQKRFNDFSLYSAISDRVDIETVFNSLDTNNFNIKCYRGDCFQNLFTHRVMSNFIDPELPTNRKIIDPGCWASNYAVRCTAEILQSTHSNLTDDSDGWYIPSPVNKSSTVSLIFGILTGNIGTIIKAAKDLTDKRKLGEIVQSDYANEIVQAFEIYVGDDVSYDEKTSMQDLIINKHIKKVTPKELEQQGGLNLKAIFKSDDKWELHGLSSINRADVNAVAFGQWITFPICSRYNLALRDIDFSNATEEASMLKKRAFYPLDEMNIYNHMLESEKINGAAKISLGSNSRTVYTTIPYVKQEFFNRIYWSKPNVAQAFINSYRIIFKSLFREYNKEFGSITKIVPMGNLLLVVFQHGIGLLPVNKVAQTEQEASPYLSSRNVLPPQVNTLTKDYGSMWKDSVIQTPSGIVYGVDTVAKKIWRTTGTSLEFISDHKISKFLNEWIDLSEYNFNEYLGHINVKAHYNEFKHDIMFTYYKDIPLDKDGKEVDLSGNISGSENPKNTIDHWKQGKTWNLCYNEILGQWATFYDWYPIESCNVDNIFFSFDKEAIDSTLNKERMPDIIKGLIPIKDYLYSYTLNKRFIDKAFTNNCIVYKQSVGDFKQDLNDISNDTYISFYYKGADLNISGEVIDEEDLWKFVICKKLDIINITTGGDILITELKQLKERPKTETGPFAYYDIRNSEYNRMYLWKHGQAGLYTNEGKIKPTNWYGNQHEFNIEFIVNLDAQILKIFNNLKIISNKTAPYKFEYEVVGEGYDWYDLKPVIQWINDKATDKDSFEFYYKEALNNSYKDLRDKYLDFPEIFYYEEDPTRKIYKLPFLHIVTADKHDIQTKSYHRDTDYWDRLRPDLPPNKDKNRYSFNTSETIIVEDELLNEQRVHTESLGNDMKKYGRVRGNMLYLEDLWDVEIRPIQFNWAYIKDNELCFTASKEMRHRDKYIKIRIRYSGEDLVVILLIITMFDYSFA